MQNGETKDPGKTLREDRPVERVERSPAVQALHMGTGLCPSCSSSDPAPCWWAWGRQQKVAQVVGPLPPTHVGDPDEAASWLGLAQT